MITNESEDFEITSEDELETNSQEFCDQEHIANIIRKLKELRDSKEGQNKLDSKFGAELKRLSPSIFTCNLNCDKINNEMKAYCVDLQVLNENDKELLKKMLFNFWLPPEKFKNFKNLKYCDHYYDGDLELSISDYKKITKFFTKEDFTKSLNLKDLEDYYPDSDTNYPNSVTNYPNSSKINFKFSPSNESKTCILNSFGLIKIFSDKNIDSESLPEDKKLFFKQIKKDYATHSLLNKIDHFKKNKQKKLTFCKKDLDEFTNLFDELAIKDTDQTNAQEKLILALVDYFKEPYPEQDQDLRERVPKNWLKKIDEKLQEENLQDFLFNESFEIDKQSSSACLSQFDNLYQWARKTVGQTLDDFAELNTTLSSLFSKNTTSRVCPVKSPSPKPDIKDSSAKRLSPPKKTHLDK
ncbi:MAG: hypothetical protein FJX30_05870 [Alphaproteobacteria bacterium]|nr:hypothetical protein [Alphaproteobacteria bacterium]